jgi:hypothetical protein
MNAMHARVHVAARLRMQKLARLRRLRDRDHFESRVFEFWSRAPAVALLQVAPDITVALAWCRSGAFAMSRMAGPLVKFLLSLP